MIEQWIFLILAVISSVACVITTTVNVIYKYFSETVDATVVSCELKFKAINRLLDKQMSYDYVYEYETKRGRVCRGVLRTFDCSPVYSIGEKVKIRCFKLVPRISIQGAIPYVPFITLFMAIFMAIFYLILRRQSL